MPTATCLASYAIAFGFMAAAIARGMQIDVAYALWSALGTTAIVLIAVLFLDSPLSLAKVVSVALVIGGVITLNLAGAH